MIRVVIESPLGAPTRELIERNKEYAKECVLDSLRRGEAPYASHLLFDQPGILDDLHPDQRETGILAGFAWGEAAHLVAVYIDRGISVGMARGTARAQTSGQRVVFRRAGQTRNLYHDEVKACLEASSQEIREIVWGKPSDRKEEVPPIRLDGSNR